MAKPKKRGLGKGLEALIPDMAAFNIIEEKVEEDRVQMISINKIYPNANQPRKVFNKENLQELARSIKIHGIIQPIVVTEQSNGYMIIAGERRWRAAKQLNMKEVPCIIKFYNEKQLIEVALIENLQRENLNTIEEAQAYEYLVSQYNVTQEQLAEALGKSRPHIANTMRLLRLDPRIIDLIVEEQITPGHGRALLSINDGEKQYQLALKIIEEGLNVRQIEELVKGLGLSKREKKQRKSNRDPFVLEIEENLKSLFGTKVNIVSGRKKGKIEIEYYSDEDLERIISLIR